MNDQSTDDVDQDGTFVAVHENIGKDGCIIELRPEHHEVPHERDMEHLSKTEAQDLYDQLGDYLQREDVRRQDRGEQ